LRNGNHDKIDVANGFWDRDSGRAVADSVMRVLRALLNYAIDQDPSIGANPVRLKRMWFKPARRERLVKADDLGWILQRGDVSPEHGRARPARVGCQGLSICAFT
jgi:hypothetical protein